MTKFQLAERISAIYKEKKDLMSLGTKEPLLYRLVADFYKSKMKEEMQRCDYDVVTKMIFNEGKEK